MKSSTTTIATILAIVATATYASSSEEIGEAQDRKLSSDGVSNSSKPDADEEAWNGDGYNPQWELPKSSSSGVSSEGEQIAEFNETVSIESPLGTPPRSSSSFSSAKDVVRSGIFNGQGSNSRSGLLTLGDAVPSGVVGRRTADRDDPITAQLNQIISDSLDQLRGTDLDFDEVVIENEIVDNTYQLDERRGLIFIPVIDAVNNMHNAFKGNNNAESESGEVKRQNGVADFEGSFKGNNNAHSEAGNVIRSNGILADDSDEEESQSSEDEPSSGDERSSSIDEERMGDEQSSGDEPSSIDEERMGTGWRRLNEVKTSIRSKDGTVKDAKIHHNNIERRLSSRDNAHKSAIIIRNKISGNFVQETKRNGIVVEPEISVLNDMSDGFTNNNNAKSKDGDVFRQNGVADFKDTFQENNNAYSVEGDVTRQNGIMNLPAEDASKVINPDMVQSVLGGLANVIGGAGEGSNPLQLLSSDVGQALLPIFLGQGDNDNDAAGLIQAFFSGNIIQSLLSGIDTEGDGGTSILELFNRLQEISNDKTSSKSKKPKPKDDDSALLNLLQSYFGGEGQTGRQVQQLQELLQAYSDRNNDSSSNETIESILSALNIRGREQRQQLIELWDRFQDIMNGDNDKTPPSKDKDDSANSALLNVLQSYFGDDQTGRQVKQLQEMLQSYSDSGNQRRRRYLRGVGAGGDKK